MSAFTMAVRSYLEGIGSVSPGACPGCEQCGLEQDATQVDISAADEPNFSWHQCDSCGSSLGGDRYPAHGITEDGEIIHLDICVDCVMYHANGEEPERWYG